MQIRIDSDSTPLETTLADLLQALQSVAENDREIEAVLLSMLDENRIHFLDVDEHAIAA